LWRSIPWIVPGVVLAVVDPGVGTSRRAVALHVEEAGAHLVGPDNGLLLPAALRLGQITAAVSLDAAGPRQPGSTFAGRDLFAPAAARLASGAALGDVGEHIDHLSLVGAALPVATVEEDPLALGCRVTWVDRFGNVQLSASLDDLARIGDPPVLKVEWGRESISMKVVFAYGDLVAGETGVVVDSYRMLSLCMREAPAAHHLGLRRGDRVRLVPGS
jgi:S-adenosyl-L-methionine hydrolase (adenosine-forming)